MLEKAGQLGEIKLEKAGQLGEFKLEKAGQLGELCQKRVAIWVSFS